MTLKVKTSFLSDLRFVSSAPDSAIQVATAVTREPYFRQLSITTVPFGVTPPTELLPTASLGRAEAYRVALRLHRDEQLGEPREGAVMQLFGRDVRGSTSVVRLPIRGDEPVRTAVTEWVIEAGRRLWIVRASWELGYGAHSQPSATALDHLFSDSALSSPDLNRPSTSLAAARRHQAWADAASGATTGASDLPFPPWWSGECDTHNFYAATNSPAYPLGAEHRGVKACGPRPFGDGGPWRWVSFGAGQNQIEWQCPELSKRFLYLAYGIPPYAANGNQMVSSYDGDTLEKVWNCTVGRAPQPDDVLSYGATTTYGHTSVVSASHVDATGNGSISVIEQNNSRSGSNTLLVRNWCAESSTGVIGWLHHPEWSADFFGDDSLTARCASAARAGQYLSESWADSGPATGCPADHFSSRFQRTLALEAGRWRFNVFADDGVRFWIDGQMIVDEWQPQRARFSHIVTVVGSDYALKLEHFENDGWADLWLDWEHVSEATTPTARVTYPQDGDVIRACPFTLEASVSDELGAVGRVEFYAFHDDGWHHLGDDHSRPYAWVWDCQSLADQEIWLAVHVSDEAGSEFVDLDGRIVVDLDRFYPEHVFHLPVVLKRHSPDI